MIGRHIPSVLSGAAEWPVSARWHQPWKPLKPRNFG